MKCHACDKRLTVPEAWECHDTCFDCNLEHHVGRCAHYVREGRVSLWRVLWAVIAAVPRRTSGRMIVLLAVLSVPGLASAQPTEGTPWWATTLAVAGPLADGATTVYALRQPGVVEGNTFYYRLFGSDVKAGEILAFKVGQAALFGAIVHAAGKQNRKAAIGVAVLTFGINVAVSGWNMKQAQRAQQLGRTSGR